MHCPWILSSVQGDLKRLPVTQNLTGFWKVLFRNKEERTIKKIYGLADTEPPCAHVYSCLPSDPISGNAQQEVRGSEEGDITRSAFFKIISESIIQQVNKVQHKSRLRTHSSSALEDPAHHQYTCAIANTLFLPIKS